MSNAWLSPANSTPPKRTRPAAAPLRRAAGLDPGLVKSARRRGGAGWGSSKLVARGHLRGPDPTPRPARAARDYGAVSPHPGPPVRRGPATLANPDQ